MARSGHRALSLLKWLPAEQRADAVELLVSKPVAAEQYMLGELRSAGRLQRLSAYAQPGERW
jgi:hypothetical protein